MKKNELTEQEMEKVAGCHPLDPEVWDEIINSPEKKEFYSNAKEAVGTAWEVVTHVIDHFG
ncbi:MAG: hypothetical protein U0N82_04355 [Oscillospiraceae bacterium]